MATQYRKKNQNPILFSHKFYTKTSSANPSPNKPETSDGGLASSLVVFVLFGVFIILIAFLGEYGIFAFQDLKQKKQTLIEEIEMLKKKEQMLLQEIDALKNNPEYIEALARRELGLVRADEVIFFLPTKAAKLAAEEPE